MPASGIAEPMTECSMRQQGESRQREWRSRMISASDYGNVLDAFQVLDRILMEFSMRLYNVPRRERLLLRGHNQRLHRAVRQRHGTGATPHVIPGQQMDPYGKANGNAANCAVRSKRQRRSKPSRKPVV